MEPSSPSSFPLFFLTCRWTCPSNYWVSSLRYITHAGSRGSANVDPRQDGAVVSNQPKQNRCESRARFRTARFFSLSLRLLPNRQPNRALKTARH